MYLSQSTKQENVYIVLQSMMFINYGHNFSIDKDITYIFEFTVRHTSFNISFEIKLCKKMTI